MIRSSRDRLRMTSLMVLRRSATVVSVLCGTISCGIRGGTTRINVSERYFSVIWLDAATPATKPTTAGSNNSHRRRSSVCSASSGENFLPGNMYYLPLNGIQSVTPDPHGITGEVVRHAKRQRRDSGEIVVVVQILGVGRPVPAHDVLEADVAGRRIELRGAPLKGRIAVGIPAACRKVQLGAQHALEQTGRHRQRRRAG